MKGYGGRVDVLLERLGSDVTPKDFLDLGLACLDQSGLPIRAQAKVMCAVEEHLDRLAEDQETESTTTSAPGTEVLL